MCFGRAAAVAVTFTDDFGPPATRAGEIIIGFGVAAGVGAAAGFGA